jgi:hypothetical protein
MSESVFEGLDVGPSAIFESDGRRWLVRELPAGLVPFCWRDGAWVLADAVPVGLLETARAMLGGRPKKKRGPKPRPAVLVPGESEGEAY